MKFWKLIYMLTGLTLAAVAIDAGFHRNWLTVFGMFLCSYICISAGLDAYRLTRGGGDGR
jgi:hypothetical protein